MELFFWSWFQKNRHLAQQAFFILDLNGLKISNRVLKWFFWDKNSLPFTSVFLWTHRASHGQLHVKPVSELVVRGGELLTEGFLPEICFLPSMRASRLACGGHSCLRGSRGAAKGPHQGLWVYLVLQPPGLNTYLSSGTWSLPGRHCSSCLYPNTALQREAFSRSLFP